MPADAAPALGPPACGRLLGQVDFWWEEVATAGEFDGCVKYGRLLRPGQAPGDVVFAEKVREDAIRADSREVVRWTLPELGSLDEVRTASGRPSTAGAAGPSAPATSQSLPTPRRRRGLCEGSGASAK